MLTCFKLLLTQLTVSHRLMSNSVTKCGIITLHKKVSMQQINSL